MLNSAALDCATLLIMPADGGRFRKNSSREFESSDSSEIAGCLRAAIWAGYGARRSVGDNALLIGCGGGVEAGGCSAAS